VCCVGDLKDPGAFDLPALGATGGGAAVFVVVPLDEASAKCAAIFDRLVTVTEFWPVLEGLELGFCSRMVSANKRSANSTVSRLAGSQPAT